MSKAKQFLAEKTEWLKNKDNALSCVFYLLYAFCFIKMCTNLTYAYGACIYQTLIDYYAYKAMAYFMAFIILLRRVRLWKLPFVITIAIYVSVSVNHFIEMAYEIEMKNAMLSKCVVWGLFLLVIVDLICTGQRTSLSRENKCLSYMMLVVFAGALMLNFQTSIIFICPLLALYLTPISKKQWTRIIDVFTISYYLAFMWIMTRSLYMVPYNEGVYMRKYYGIFYNLVPIGSFCAGALVCALYWVVKITRKGWHLSWEIVLCFAVMAYPAVACAMNGSRTSELGYLAAILAIFIFCPLKRDKKECIKRGGVVTGVIIGMLFLVVCGGIFLFHMTTEVTDEIVDNYISNSFFNEKVKYWIGITRYIAGGTVSENIVANPFLAIIDRLTSNRIGIFIQCIKDVLLLGSNDVTVMVGDQFFHHPHNTYLTWLRWYGWIGGIPMIGWFLTYVGTCIKRVLQEKYDTYLLPFLWGIFMLVVMLTETIIWTYLVAFVLLMLQYPLLIHMEEGD